MAKRKDPYLDERGASARQLVLIFLAAVAVCAVFFSLGFVVGYNHSPSKAGVTTENVTASGNIPPTVNPPEGGSGQPSTGGIQTENVNPGSTSIPQPVSPQPSPAPPAETAQTRTHKPARKVVHKATHKAEPKRGARYKPAAAPRRQEESNGRARSTSDFAVQVMASRTRVDAENLVKLLKSHGFRVYILSPQQVHSSDHLFRVRVGPYPSRVSADSARDELESEGFRPFVVHY